MKRTIQLISAICCFALVNSLHAVNGTWDQTKSGNWSDTNNWIGGIIADGAGSRADGQSIGAFDTRTITADGPRTIGGFYMNVNGGNRAYALNGSTITLAGGDNMIQAVNGPFFIDSVIAGTEGMVARTYGDNGRVILGAANTYTGDTQITKKTGNGMLVVSNANAIPHGSGYGNVVFTDANNEHGILDLLTNDITINGLSTLAGTGDGGQVSSTSQEAGTSTLTVGDGDASATFDGVLQDGLIYGRQIALTKIGTGTQVLNGNSTHSGTTTVEAGTLQVNGFLSGGGTFYVKAGGVLDGIGSLYGPLTTDATGAVSTGTNNPGILTLYGGMDLSSGGTYIWDLAANSDGNPGTDYDQIVMYGGTLDLNDSTLIVSLGGSVNTADPFWNSSHTWTIISAPGLAGSTTNKYLQVVGGTPPGDFSTANDGNSVMLTFTYTGVVPQTPKPVKITSITGAGTGSVTVNYTNTIAGTNYTLQYRTNLSTSPWLTAGSKTAAGTTDSQTDGSAGTSERYYRVYYFFTP